MKLIPILLLIAAPVFADWTDYPMKRDQRGIREIEEVYSIYPEDQRIDIIAGDIKTINWLNDGYRILYLLDTMKGSVFDDGRIWQWVLAMYDYYEWEGNKLFLFILVAYWSVIIGD